MSIPPDAAAIASSASTTAVQLSATLVDLAPILAPITNHILAKPQAAIDHLTASLAVLAGLQPGVFAALNSLETPTLGLRLSVTLNAAGNGFDAPGLPSTFTFGVNNINEVHGFTMFLRQRPAVVDQSPFLIDGVVDPGTGVLAPPLLFNIGALGTVAAFPGLVTTDSEGRNLTNPFPGTFAGSINLATGVTSGTWQTGPGMLTTGTFTGNLLP